MDKPILCVDFDGVVHLYTSPWTKATEIWDGMVPGFAVWARKAARTFTLVIYSSRSQEPGGIEAMQRFMKANGAGDIEFEYAREKPKAFLTIDDRAITFGGDWSNAALDPDVLIKFKPWNKK